MSKLRNVITSISLLRSQRQNWLRYGARQTYNQAQQMRPPHSEKNLKFTTQQSHNGHRSYHTSQIMLPAAVLAGCLVSSDDDCQYNYCTNMNRLKSKILSSSVQLLGTDTAGCIHKGHGFFINHMGYIVTDLSLVHDLSSNTQGISWTIRLCDGTERKALVKAVDYENSVAFLVPACLPPKFGWLVMSDESENIPPGEHVATLRGDISQKPDMSKVSLGCVCTGNKQISLDGRKRTFIETTAPVLQNLEEDVKQCMEKRRRQGVGETPIEHFGAPLVDMTGEVIGIVHNTHTDDCANETTLCVPSRAIVKSLNNFCRGMIRYERPGLKFDVREAQVCGITDGVKVRQLRLMVKNIDTKIAAGTGEEIWRGDVITHIDGVEVFSIVDFYSEISTKKKIDITFSKVGEGCGCLEENTYTINFTLPHVVYPEICHINKHQPIN